ncbi:MAG: squalene--hopene cyclase [Nocardiopsaceae bacterium]|nr:squalene--hopene cyclase [Nocardiopsaceae bacterium]
MTQASSGRQAAAGDARAALERARDHLLSLQHEQGWWQGELETNVTMDAEDLLLREFLGIRTEEETAAAARWIAASQRDDGTWANFFGGPGDLSTTVEAYVALKLAGHRAGEPAMARAAGWIRARGGIPASRVFTRVWLALFGQWSWDDLPVMPPEMIYLPAWFPLNIYDWGCWARQTIVPLTIICSLRPVRPFPITLDELWPDQAGDGAAAPAPAAGPQSGWDMFFGRLDQALHAYHRYGLRTQPPAAIRRAAIRRCTDWIIARQERDGCWGGIQPPWVYSLMALHLLGYRLDHPVMQRGLAGLRRFIITEDTPDGPVRRLEACQSPVWDTVLAMIALSDAGLPPGHPALERAAAWVIGEEVPGPGDWQVRRPRLDPGGWAFEFDNDIYPDLDDTAEVILALRQTEAGGARSADRHPAIGRGLRWLVGMQSRDGGWGAFDADNTSPMPARLPFCDFGAVTDPPSADVTAHIVEALAAEGMAGTRAARRGVVWLLRAQEDDGSWFGRWGANYVYGTGAVVPALVAAGVRPEKPVIRRAVAWLEAHQNPDGGWGEDLRSYDDPGLAGQGTSTASQTAWALLALLAAGASSGGRPPHTPPEGHSSAVQAGIRWLAATQHEDGTWDEPQYTGTGFPGDFYINYHLYRQMFPLSALGRYLKGEA